MIQEYINAAMSLAQYQGTGKLWTGVIPGAEGLKGEGRTLEECVENLQSGFEEWMLIQVAKGSQPPEFKGVGLYIPKFV